MWLWGPGPCGALACGDWKKVNGPGAWEDSPVEEDGEHAVVVVVVVG